MRQSIVATLGMVALFSLWAGCGTSGNGPEDGQNLVTGDASVDPDAGSPPDSGGDASVPPAPLWQVAMGSEIPYPDFVSTWTTFRIPFRVMRSGTQVRVAFLGNKGAFSLRDAYFGLQSGPGAVEGNAQLTFSGSVAVEVGQDQLVVSDPLDYAVVGGERYAVSFVGRGNVARSLDDVVNDGVVLAGAHSNEPVLTGTAEPAIRGVRWVAVMGPPQRVTAVLGDSIGAGSFATEIEARFVDRAQVALGEPVIDSSIGGDGTYRAMLRLQQDVIDLPGVTDCVVQVTTNDLESGDPQMLIDRLERMYKQLSDAGIRPWGGTIIPKGAGVLSSEGEWTRQQVNAFIRATPLVHGVVDFAADFSDPANDSLPKAGALTRDGIHPTSFGHALMTDSFVKALQAK